MWITASVFGKGKGKKPEKSESMAGERKGIKLVIISGRVGENRILGHRTEQEKKDRRIKTKAGIRWGDQNKFGYKHGKEHRKVNGRRRDRNTELWMRLRSRPNGYKIKRKK